jgi:hypothetical protein
MLMLECLLVESSRPQWLPVLILIWITAWDARATAVRWDELGLVHAGTSEGYLLGVRFGVCVRFLVVAASGWIAIYGFRFALAAFVTGATYQALQPTFQVVRQCRRAVQAKLGSCSTGVAAIAGLAWFSFTRGVPLLLLLRAMPEE